MPQLSFARLGTAWFAAASLAFAVELHVSPAGDDNAPGTAERPLRTIQRGADLAQPGDTVTVHAGVYRERVSPPRSGLSDTQRITFQAAPDEAATLTGSEIVRGWRRLEGDVWVVEIPNSFFGAFNPFADEIRGDWFDPRDRKHHTGAVYARGDWLTEAATKTEVLARAASPLWFAEVDAAATRVWAQFPGLDPNSGEVEVNVRRTVFYPEKPGMNFITVRGFTLCNAATPWAPPTAEQVGLLGTHWSRGWIIENNRVHHSTCSGISLGKHGDEYDNTSANTATGYVVTIERAQAHRIPWDRDHIGHHVVRGNHISHCEQAGIVGSLGCSFSTVSGNTIHDIHVRRLFSGAEQAGIKFHGAIDCLISGNHIYRTNRGLWLDWMAQGARVTGNLFHDNGPEEDLFFEVNHGPLTVDNNLLLSAFSLHEMSEGSAYLHNLFAGQMVARNELGRDTPYLERHSTRVAAIVSVKGGDHRFHNNLILSDTTRAVDFNSWITGSPHGFGPGLSAFDQIDGMRITASGNSYAATASASRQEQEPLLLRGPTCWKLQQEGDAWFLDLQLPTEFGDARGSAVSGADLGVTAVSRQPFVDRDDQPQRFDHDFLGKPRDARHPTPGPFEGLKAGSTRLRVR
ncbi:right-handed parallel beta-helix repeat-containing protein [Nibricoccus sp. IMCC34717]|uniref:right-handed parallel beta-helix repeat-containing protein n=1 Tax=Nibricoccus sp. IMCC34717 TaxID=3034021 RepID=UPI0038501A97